jgi:RND family efflux transporter MFP subunit
MTARNPAAAARVRLLITRTLALALAAGLAACSGAPAGAAKEAAREPTPVRIQPVGTGPALPPVATNGVVASKDEMRLSFKVGGVIRRIAVRPGETVKAGTVLAEIELAEIDAQVEQARQLAAKAQRDLERGERLYADQVISLVQLQNLRTQAEVQQAQLRSAQFNRGYAAIVAPRDGVVLRKLAEERELVAAGAPVIVLGAKDGGYVVKAALADREIVRLTLGDAAEARLDAWPGVTLHGRLAEISRAADERTGLFAVEVQLDPPAADVTLASGLVARLQIAPSAAAGRTLPYVPIAAVVEGDRDRASVFVVQGDKVSRRAIRVAFIAPDCVAVAEGLQPGERVVTDGALYLQDGETVRVVPDAAQAAGARPGAAGCQLASRGRRTDERPARILAAPLPVHAGGLPVPRGARLVRLRERSARGRPAVQALGVLDHRHLPRRRPEGPGAARREAHRGPPRRARRREAH